MDNAAMKDWFNKLFADYDLEYKAVFGNPTWLCSGNMFAKIEKGKFVIRLDQADKAALMEKNPKVGKHIMFNGMHAKDADCFPKW